MFTGDRTAVTKGPRQKQRDVAGQRIGGERMRVESCERKNWYVP